MSSYTIYHRYKPRKSLLLYINVAISLDADANNLCCYMMKIRTFMA